ncbi:hypothetical protein GG344DRAFT_83350 [Lentinula edodes]|nr:hypothetical protein GG344DRAFT_83350 [Lentinula edodes]
MTAIRAQEQENKVVERGRKLAEAATARSQRGTSTGETSASPRRPIVETLKVKNKGKGKAKAQPVGEDPDDDDGNEDWEPCHPYAVKREGGDENHSWLITINTRLASTGAVSAIPGPSGIVSERPRNLKWRRIMENSDEEKEEEKGREEEEEQGEEKEGEGEEEGDALVPTEARSEKGKEREEVE